MKNLNTFQKAVWFIKNLYLGIPEDEHIVVSEENYCNHHFMGDYYCEIKSFPKP
jgi:hypothetical protein